MANTFTLISSQTLSSSAASITFSSIPSTYTDLLVRISGRSTGSSTVIELTLNGSSSSYTNKRLYGDGSATASDSNNTTFISNIGLDDTGFTANTFSNTDIYIPNYTGSNYKSTSGDGVSENNATLAFSMLAAGLWSNTAAITSITLAQGGANIAQYSTAYLYGIKNS
jgi:hypothetical protein